MAGIASDCEFRRDVIRIGCASVVGLMARVAGRRHRLELAIRRALVASLAIDRGVRSSQGKTIIVLLNVLNGNLPSTHRMTLLAIRSKLALVNVGVAILATLAHVRKDRLAVALRASHRCMHAAKRIPGLVVIEFRHGTNRFPRAGGVAVLTGDV